MRTIIRIDYRFTMDGTIHEGRGVMVGETIEAPENGAVNEVAAVCHALDIDADDLAERFPAIPVWEPDAITPEHWKDAGIVFEYCELV